MNSNLSICSIFAELKALVEVLARNTTVNSLRISAVIGQGIRTDHLIHLSHYLGT